MLVPLVRGGVAVGGEGEVPRPWGRVRYQHLNHTTVIEILLLSFILFPPFFDK
jgi:hypothetical protein